MLNGHDAPHSRSAHSPRPSESVAGERSWHSRGVYGALALVIASPALALDPLAALVYVATMLIVVWRAFEPRNDETAAIYRSPPSQA